MTWVRSPFFQKSAKYCCTAPRADSLTGSSNKESGDALGAGVSMTALAVAVGAGVAVALGVGVGVAFPEPFPAGVGVGVGAGTGLQDVLTGLVAARQAPL